MTHPLLRTDDGQDALVKLHSQAVAQPNPNKRASDATIADGFRRGAVRWFEKKDHTWVGGWDGYSVTEADCRQVPNASALQSSDLAHHPVVSVAAVAEAPEQWHTEAPTVAGVYWTRANTDSGEYSRWWDGACWHSAFGASPREGRAINLGSVKWLKLIEADAPQADADGWIKHVPTEHSVCPVPAEQIAEVRMRDGGNIDRTNRLVLSSPWRQGTYFDGSEMPNDIVAYRLKPQAVCGGKKCGITGGHNHSAECHAEHDAACGADTRPLLKLVKGCDVPEVEKLPWALFHFRDVGCSRIRPAKTANQCGFYSNTEYLRAAPGVREGDAFRAELYRSV